jgi:hypothetical protein
MCTAPDPCALVAPLHHSEGEAQEYALLILHVTDRALLRTCSR